MTTERSEKSGQNVKIVIASVAIVAAMFFVFRSTGRGQGDGTVSQLYFTTDDGATWFVDSAEKRPPFAVDGKEAVQAKLFRCGDGKPFVGYLAKNQGPDSGKSGTVGPVVKKLGDKDWVSVTSEAGSKVTLVQCPDGKNVPDDVFP